MPLPEFAVTSSGVILTALLARCFFHARTGAAAEVGASGQKATLAHVVIAMGTGTDQRPWHPLAAGVLYPSTGWLLSPIIAAAAMAASSLSVVGNTSRLRRLRASATPPADRARAAAGTPRPPGPDAAQVPLARRRLLAEPRRLVASALPVGMAVMLILLLDG